MARVPPQFKVIFHQATLTDIDLFAHVCLPNGYENLGVASHVIMSPNTTTDKKRPTISGEMVGLFMELWNLDGYLSLLQ